MSAISVRITQGGRLVIPATFRKALKIVDGEMVVLEVQGNTLKVVPLRDRLDAIQAACSRLLAGGGIVNEFLEERRREAAGERD